jgi:hypothetical protein
VTEIRIVIGLERFDPNIVLLLYVRLKQLLKIRCDAPDTNQTDSVSCCWTHNVCQSVPAAVPAGGPTLCAGRGRRPTPQLILSAAASHSISIGIGEKVIPIWVSPFLGKNSPVFTRLKTTSTGQLLDGTRQSATQRMGCDGAACAPPARPR